MIAVRVLEEMVLRKPGGSVFCGTLSLEREPEVGDVLTVGDGEFRRQVKVVRLRQAPVHKGSLFEVREPWAICRQI